MRNGRETVAHCLNILDLRKVALVTELGYQNYSNNINAPFEMFTSIAVVDRQIMELGYQNYSNNIDVPFEMFTSIAVVDMQIMSATF